MSTDGENDGPPFKTRSSDPDHVPSNPELAERVVRVEEQMDHVVETVDRIENRLTEQHSNLEDAVANNTEDTAKLKSKYRLVKWVVGTTIALLGTIGTIGGVIVTIV